MRPAPSPELVAKAEALRAEGMTHKAIGRRLGVSHSTVRYWINPEYAAKHRAETAENNKAKRDAARVERQKTYGRPGSIVACSHCNGRHHPDDCEEAVRASCRCGLSLFTDAEKASGSCSDCLPTNAASFAAARMVATGNHG